MPVWIARTVPRRTVRGASACHGGDSANVVCHRASQVARRPATCLQGSPRATRGQVSWSAGLRWWFAAASGLPRWLSCRTRGLAARQAWPGPAARRGGLLLGCLGLAVPASSSRRGLGASAQSSRQAPLAGALSPWPGKQLLPDLAFSTRQAPLAGPWYSRLDHLAFVRPGKGRGDSCRPPGRPCRGRLLLPVHKFGVLRYPYFSTPTIAPQSSSHLAGSINPAKPLDPAKLSNPARLLNSAPTTKL